MGLFLSRCSTVECRATSEAIKAIKSAFDANGVTIPFPIRTLDFDPNGGVDLQAALKGSGNGALSAGGSTTSTDGDAP